MVSLIVLAIGLSIRFVEVTRLNQLLDKEITRARDELDMLKKAHQKEINVSSRPKAGRCARVFFILIICFLWDTLKP